MHTRTENKQQQRIEYIRNLLESSIQPLTSDKFSFRKLEAIAGVRFALGEVATLLHAKYVDAKELASWGVPFIDCVVLHRKSA